MFQVGSLSGATGPPVTMTRADGSQPLSGSRYRVVVQADMAGQSRWRYYTAQIWAHTPNSAGNWSSPVAFTALDPPTGLTVGPVTDSIHVTRVTASWTAGLGLDEVFTGYLLRIHGPRRHPRE